MTQLGLRRLRASAVTAKNGIDGLAFAIKAVLPAQHMRIDDLDRPPGTQEVKADLLKPAVARHDGETNVTLLDVFVHLTDLQNLRVL